MIKVRARLTKRRINRREITNKTEEKTGRVLGYNTLNDFYHVCRCVETRAYAYANIRQQLFEESRECMSAREKLKRLRENKKFVDFQISLCLLTKRPKNFDTRLGTLR